MRKLVLTNGKIYIDRDNFAQAFYAEDGIIKLTGSNEAVLAAAGADAEVIDCGGKTVIPGINDSHMHLLYSGIYLSRANLFDTKSVEDVVERGKAFLSANPELAKTGILGAGWNQDLFTEGEKRVPKREDMDKITTEAPVFFRRACGHVAAGNTKLCDILVKRPEFASFVASGEVEVDEDGKPTGFFKEGGTGFAESVYPEFTVEDYERCLLIGARHAMEQGITSVQTNDILYIVGPKDLVFKAVHNVYDNGKCLLRYRFQVNFPTPEDFKNELENGEFKHGNYSGKYLKIGPLKLVKDGSLGGRTAAMRDEYVDDPGNYGIVNVTNDEFDEFCRIADDNDIQVVTHCIGDRAVEDVVASYERVLRDGKNPLRHTIIHCQVTDMPLLERIARGDILTAVQPIFLDSDLHAIPSRCGDAKSSTSYAFNTMEKLGIKTSYGTDCPIEDCNPFPCIYSAVTRKDKHGFPEGGFYPNECVDVYTAVDAYTKASAYEEFAEDTKGRIKPGFVADAVILDKDIFSCDPMDIRNIKPEMTIIDGYIAYRK